MSIDHRKVGMVMELSIGVVRSMYFVLGFRHEVGKHGDFVSSELEVVFLLLHFMVSFGQRMVLGNRMMVVLMVMLR